MTINADNIDAGETSFAVLYFESVLELNEPKGVSFNMRPKGFFTRSSRMEAVSSGHEEFHRLFMVRGAPEDYVKRAMQRIVASGSHMLDCLHRNVSIDLNDSNLVCVQTRALSVEDQIVLFNLLCDLAELAERTESIAKDLGK